VNLLNVRHLSKRYERFCLNDVTFTLEQGYIMGFIGINGAGKTTTLKSVLNMVHPDSGSVEIIGKDIKHCETAIKQDLGVVLGDKDMYKSYRIRDISRVVSRFYHNWDESAYRNHIERFSIDPGKKVGELSEGMKTKYFLALAMSHHARLYILDEPTSGLDPAARDELLELFQELVEDGAHSILYSTHITSDLEKCADHILYIDNGSIIGCDTKDDFLESYKLVKGDAGDLTSGHRSRLIAVKYHPYGFTGLIKSADAPMFGDFAIEQPTMEEIMIYHAKRETIKQEPSDEQVAV
jgi:ABC-2 type transport system ATP-binding protein